MRRRGSIQDSGLDRPSGRLGAVARRGALALGVGLAASVAAKRGGAAEEAEMPPEVPEWETRPGAPVLAAPYGVPSPFERDVVRRARRHAHVKTPLSSFSLTPLQDLHGIVTPNGLHYERHHNGVPAIDPDAHRLLVHGLVRRPLLFTMDDLLRFPAVSRFHFLECAGNTQGWKPGPADWTVQDTHGLLSCCEWTGVMLSTVLEEVGASKSARWLLAESADAAGMDRSVPMAKAYEDAMLVYAQNGERLRPEQGYPLRLLLPGFEGNMNIKWLRRIKLGREPFETREETSKYTDLMANGKARQFTLDMEAKSVITFPSGDMKLPGPGFYNVTGLAWSGRGRVQAVDVSTDAGATWYPARIDSLPEPMCTVRFSFPWMWDGKPAVLQSRCTDETGYIQPTLKQLIAIRGDNGPFGSIYHLNAIQSWGVAADGSVTNVHA